MLRDSLKWTMPPLVIQIVARKFVTAMAAVGLRSGAGAAEPARGMVPPAATFEGADSRV